MSIARMHMCVQNDSETQDCVTGLHDQRSRECNQVTPVECVSLSFFIHPYVLAFITHISCINRIEIAHVWWIWCKIVTFIYIFLKFAIYFIALVNFGETCHLNGHYMAMVLLLCCYDCDSIMTSCALNTYCDITQCMNGLWIFITKLESPKQGRLTTIIRTASKQLCVCDN